MSDEMTPEEKAQAAANLEKLLRGETSGTGADNASASQPVQTPPKASAVNTDADAALKAARVSRVKQAARSVPQSEPQSKPKRAPAKPRTRVKSSRAARGAKTSQCHGIPSEVYDALLARYDIRGAKKNDVLLAALVASSGLDLRDVDEVSESVIDLASVMRQMDTTSETQTRESVEKLLKARADDRRLLAQLEAMINWLIGDRIAVLGRTAVDVDSFDLNEAGAQDLLDTVRRSFKGFHAEDVTHNGRIGAGRLAKRRAQ